MVSCPLEEIHLFPLAGEARKKSDQVAKILGAGNVHDTCIFCKAPIS